MVERNVNITGPCDDEPSYADATSNGLATIAS